MCACPGLPATAGTLVLESTPPWPRRRPRRYPDEREQSLARLQVSMEQEQRFREGELSLEQLAEHLALMPAELS